MTRTHPLTSPGNDDDRLYLGCCKLDLQWGVCPLTMKTFMDTQGTMEQHGPNIIANASRYIISDFRTAPGYETKPFVTGYPYMVSYLEVPLISPLGYTLGSYCVVDNKPREFNREDTISIMTDMAAAIMHHLDSAVAQQRLGRAENLITGLSNYAGRSQSLTERSKAIHEGTQNIDQPLPGDLPHPSHTQHVIEQQHQSVKTPELPETPDTAVTTVFEHSSISSSRATSNATPFSAGTTSIGATPTTSEPDDTSVNNDDKSTTKHQPATKANLSHDHDHTGQHITLLAEAAEITRDAMNLDGLIFLDAVPSQIRNRSGTKPPFIRHSSHSSASAFDNLAKDKNTNVDKSKVLAQSLKAGSSSEFFDSSITHKEIPDSIIQRLMQRFPQGGVFSADESGPIADTYGPGVKIDTSQDCESTMDESDESALFKFLPQARYILFVPLWHFQRGCWFTAMVGWVADTFQSMDMREVNLLAAFGNSVVSKVAFTEASTISRVKSDFISSISHELRSPLHGIMATAELMREQISDPSVIAMVDMIDSCGSTLLDTFNNLLEHARINKSPALPVANKTVDQEADTESKLSTQQRLVDLGHLVEDVVEIVTLGYTASEKHKGPVRRSSTSTLASQLDDEEDTKIPVLVTVNIEPGVDWLQKVESGAWKRIVMNLVGNALKYTETGVIEITLKTLQFTGDDGHPRNDILLSVQDTGIGISEEYLQYHLFTSFSQENSMMPGTGLGLSIVKQLVHGIGGKIDVESQKGSGTLVKVVVPFKKIPKNSLAPGDSSSDQSSNFKDLNGLTLCLISSSKVHSQKGSENADFRELKRVNALHTTIRTLAEDVGMTVKILDMNEDYPPVDIFLFDNEVIKGDINHIYEKLLTLSPLIVLQSGFNSKLRHEVAKRSTTISVSYPIRPTKLRSALLDALRKSKKSSPANNGGKNGTLHYDLASAPSERRMVRPIISKTTSFENNTPIAPATITESPTLHILLVDDNAINLKLLIALMDKLPYTFETATDGLQAVQLHQLSMKPGNRLFDIIFMDISMPVMNGFEATRQIRKDEEKAGLQPSQIIALTGLGSEAAQIEASAAGFDMYLKKPVKLKEIRAILNEGVPRG
jgi:signal transduction histidine kinase/ActR/RegA family two-component response regulator